MDYPTFESRVLELLFKTDARLIPQFVAFRVGCPVQEATKHLETMAKSGVIEIEVDDTGSLYYDVRPRPAPTNEALSWIPSAPATSQSSTSLMAVPPIQDVRVVHYVHHTDSVGEEDPHVRPIQATPSASPPRPSALVVILLTALLGPLGLLHVSQLGGTLISGAMVGSFFFVGHDNVPVMIAAAWGASLIWAIMWVLSTATVTRR